MMYLRNNLDQFVYLNNEYMIKLDILHMILVVSGNFSHDKHNLVLILMKRGFLRNLIKVFYVRLWDMIEI